MRQVAILTVLLGLFTGLVVVDLVADVTLVLTASPASPVSKGQPITLTATMPVETTLAKSRAKSNEVQYTFSAQRLTPCPQSFTIAADSTGHVTNWTPPVAGQYSFRVSARKVSPGKASSRQVSNTVAVSVEQRVQLNPVTITPVNVAENLFRVSATLADPGYPASYTFTFTDFRPGPEIGGTFNDSTLPFASWVAVAQTTVTSTSPAASWEVTLPPKNHKVKVELVRQRPSDCDTATGKIEKSYVVPLPPQ